MNDMLKAYTRQLPRGHSTETDETLRKYAPMVYRMMSQIAERMPVWVDREYLFSAGMVGLLEAHSRFDPGRGVSFEAYAKIRVKGAVLDELRSLDHLSRTMRRRSRRLVSSREELEKLTGQTVADDAVAAAMGVTVEEVHRWRTRRIRPETLDPSILDALEIGALWEVPAMLSDTLEWAEYVKILSRTLAELPERNRFVVALYYESELTLQDIADVLGVTQSRISQILRKTMEMLRERLQDAMTTS